MVLALLVALRGPAPAVAQAPASTHAGGSGARAARAGATPAEAPEASEANALQRALRRFEHEPSVALVLRAALRHSVAAQVDVSRAVRRARRSAWLPELRVRLRRGRERDANATQSGTNLSTDDDTVLEGTLLFDLPRAVYASDEPAWSREARSQDAARVQLIRLVVGLYFERRRLQLELAMGAEDLELLLRIVEIEALLDGLTGGEFGRLLRASEPSPSPSRDT